MSSNKNIIDNLNFFKENYYLKFNIDIELLHKILKDLSKLKWNNFEDRKNPKKFTYPKFENNTLFFEKINHIKMIINNTDVKNNIHVNKIINKPEILKIVESYFNSKSKVVNIDIFYNENDGRFNSNNIDTNKLKYHIDDYHLIKKNNKKFCKLFIPLTNVNENNGVTHIVKGSAHNIPKDAIEKLDKLSTQRFDDEYIEQNYDKNNIIKLTSKMGEIYLARTDGFHKGGFVKNGKRIILIVEYNPV